MDCGLPCPLSCHGKVMLVVCVLQCGLSPAKRTHGRSAPGPNSTLETVRFTVPARLRCASQEPGPARPETFWALGLVCAAVASQNPPCPEPYPHQSLLRGRHSYFLPVQQDTAQSAASSDFGSDLQLFRAARFLSEKRHRYVAT